MNSVRAPFGPFFLVLCLFAMLSLEARADERVDDLLARAQRQDLELPGGLPDFFDVSVMLDGQPCTLLLDRYSLRSDDFQVFEDDGTGLRQVEAGPVRTYRGRVLERPSASVAASLMPGGLKAAILERDHPTWFVQPEQDFGPAVNGSRHLVYRHAEDWADQFRCGNGELAGGSDAGMFSPALGRIASDSGTPATGSAGGSAGIQAGNCTKVCDVAWDADYEMFVQSGSSVALTVAEVTAVQNAVEAFYARDALITYLVGTVIVRTAEPDPYDETGFARLGEFVTEWNNNQGHISRDLAHFASAHPTLWGSGVAYLTVVCHSTYGYGMSGFSGGFGSAVAVTGHEMGHNWSGPHCQDASCVAMCGACEQIGERGTDVMMAHRNAVGCLVDGTLSLPDIAPHARLDEVVLADRMALTIDVLANDLDANCDLLGIDSFDASSEAGGTVERSVGTGPGGRDELLYTPPLDSFLGPDVFHYVAGDGTGMSDSGEVQLLDPRPDLTAYYKLNEKQNRHSVVDHSGAGNEGRYEGTVVKRLPPAHPDTKYSVQFDGIDGRVEIPTTAALTRLRNNITVAAWVYPELSSNVKVVSNPGLWSFGYAGSTLWFAVHGYDYLISEDFVPTGLPVGEWSHIAATFKPDNKVRFYLNGAPQGIRDMGIPRRSAAGTWYLGTEGGDRFLQGNLDDVQVYESWLSARQVQLLYDNPGVTICGESWAVYGAGHPGNLGVPGIRVTGNIRLDDTFRVRYDNSLGASTVGVLFFGFDTASAPLFGGELLVDIFDLLVLPIPSAGGSLPLSVPNNPVACGLPVYFQLIEKDIVAAGGYSFTRGLQVEIGN